MAAFCIKFSAKSMIAQRQKLIKMADASELGWRVVNEYVSNPLASDSEDEKRIFKAEARANRKYKAEKTRKARRSRVTPYWRQQSSKMSVEQQANAVTPQPTRRPPGLCFACGKPGHWKGSPECSVNISSTNNKISTVFECLTPLFVNPLQMIEVGANLTASVSVSSNFSANEESASSIEMSAMEVSCQGNQVVSPIGRLRNCFSKWQQATNSRFILNVIQDGYRLPLKETPCSIVLKNNKSARENLTFVYTEVQSLLEKGVVSRSIEVPHVVNPLTVAYNKKGKPRLVLDCRHVNKYLHLFKVKFEDIRVAETIFEENSYLYTWDLASAYHHIQIHRESRSFLGFSVPDSDGTLLYYVFNALPFGIRTAGHIFTKILRVVVSYLRANSHKVIMFLDDGIGGHKSLEFATRSSQFVKQSLIEFGFLLADEKCNWVPVQKVVWLGHLIDMEKNRLFISDERIQRLQTKLNSVLFQIRSDKYNIIHVKVLASATGQIISLQSVIGNKTRLKTRELFNCINARASWNAPVRVTEAALLELVFWKENIISLNSQGKSLKDKNVCLFNIFADASATGYGGYVEYNCSHEQLLTEDIHREVSQQKLFMQSSSKDIQSGFIPLEVDSKLHKTESESSEKDYACYIASEAELQSLEMGCLCFIGPSVKGFDCLERSPEVDLSHRKMCFKRAVKSESLVQPYVTDISAKSRQLSDSKHNHAHGLSDLKHVEKSKSINVEDSEVLGNWTAHERYYSSTWRETEAVSRVIRTHVNILRHSVVKVYSDNKNVKSVLLNGSRKQDIHNVAISLNEFCDKENIIMQPEWIPRNGNDRADYLSRCVDSDDWEINHDIFAQLSLAWGPFTIDRFASHLNNKCKRFNSRWWVPGTEAVDAVSQFWGHDNNWLVPPPRLVAVCIEKLISEKSNGTLIIPAWKSSPYWPCLMDDKGFFKGCIKEVVNLSRNNVIIPGKGNNGIFARESLPFDILALKFVHG